jgi:hypothetical protein
MADQGPMLQGVNWRQALPFTHIFRAFRVAVHPSKLLMGLALLLTIYVGGRGLDSLWPVKNRAVMGEATLFELAPGPSEFEQARQAAADVSPDRYGLFRSFFVYEINQFSGVVEGVWQGQWFRSSDNPGVLDHVYNFIAVGPVWLGRIHPLYAVLFAALFLFAWSLFGGALARLAAVHVARDEKISIRQALNFAVGKFLSFVSAPIIPLIIVLVVGLLLAAGALVGNLPYLGPVVVGAGFFLALLAGFVMTLVILGSIGGFNLMYPTVAVEGSDSFDAISRSFSYIYARPWQMLFYTALSVAYGAITYLFVRYFIFLMLMLTHHFVQMGTFLRDANGNGILPVMWPSPADTGRLTFMTHYDSLNWGERIGAGLIAFWVYLVIGTLGAYAISFYFSANTIIYFLLRRDLDATEMDDVYLEQTDDDFGRGAGNVETVVTETVTDAGVEVTVTEIPLPSTDAAAAPPQA